MKPPYHISRVVLALLVFVPTLSIGFSHLPGVELESCNDLYICPAAGTQQLGIGHKYVYSFQLHSTLEYPESGQFIYDSRFRQVFHNGSVVVTPLTSCEILIAFGGGIEGATPSGLKVAFHDGSIHRVCTLNKDGHDSAETNVLKALASMLNLGDGSTSRLEHPKGYTFETDSKGTSLTKLVACENDSNKLYKYKSTKHSKYDLGTEKSLGHIKSKAEEFEGQISKFTQRHPDLCDEEDLQAVEEDFYKTSQDLAVCTTKFNANNVVTASQCLEIQEMPNLIPGTEPAYQLYGSISITLNEVSLTSQLLDSQLEGTAFFKTSILQLDNHSQTYLSQELEQEPIEYLHKTVEKIMNSTKRGELELADIEIMLSKANRILDRINEQELLAYLEELGSSSQSPASQKVVYFYLDLVSSRIPFNDNISTFFITALTKKLLQNHISSSNLESLLNKIVVRLYLDESSPALLEFSRFLVDFVENEGYSQSLRLYSLMAFSRHLGQFCGQASVSTGTGFCEKSEPIQEWINATIIEKIDNGGTLFEEFMGLEAYVGVKEHSSLETECEKLYDLKNEGKGPIILWTILNCYRKQPCSKQGKQFFRNLVQDKNSPSNSRITAFLGMTKCFLEVDNQVIQSIFKDNAVENDELHDFIRGYKANLDVYGVGEPALSLPEDVDLKIFSNADTSRGPKRTRASNTLAFIPDPAFVLPRISLETNLLYFDKMARVPELITLSLKSNLEVGIFEAQIYIADKRGGNEQATLLNFSVTILIRSFGRTLYLKEIHLTTPSIVELVDHFRRFVNNPSSIPYWGWNSKLRDFIVGEFHSESAQLLTMLNRYKFIPTLNGIPGRVSRKFDGFSSLLVDKDDCSGIFREGEGDATCQLIARPEYFSKAFTSVSLGFETGTSSGALAEQRFEQEGTVLAELPINVELARNGTSSEETITIKMPSLQQMTVGKLTIFEGTEKPSRNWNFGSSNQKMKIVISKNSQRKTITATVTEQFLEAKLEVGSSPLYYVEGALTFLDYSKRKGNYIFQVGAKNSEDYKRLQGKLVNDRNEYSFDAYFIREVRNQDYNDNYGFFSCSRRLGTGILCVFPFCMFCGTEYFIGMTVSTPRFKKLNIIEGSATQTFPDKSAEVVLKLYDLNFKVTVENDNDTTILNTLNIKDSIERKLASILQAEVAAEKDQSKAGDDDQSQKHSKQDPSFLRVHAEMFSRSLGGGRDMTFVYFFIPYRSASLGICELRYPSSKSEESEYISLELSKYRPHSKVANLTSESLQELTALSTQFPTINTNLRYNFQNLYELNRTKEILTIRPLSILPNEEIKVIKTENALVDSYYRSSWTWENFHFDQSYQVFLPKGPAKLPFFAKVVKGRLFANRQEGTLEEAGLELQVGIDHALELRYDFMPDENNATEILTSVTTDYDTYGLHHRIEPVHEAISNIADNGDAETPNLQKYKYKGTYVLGEISMKAAGVFEGRIGREILPFSKFDVRVSSVDGLDLGIRIFGSETVQTAKSIHNMKIGVDKGDTKLFVFKNEIVPSDPVPIKATVYVKDHGEAKIFDSSKSTTKRNLQVKANWLSKNRVFEGHIGFPTTFQIPLYLDFDVSMRDATGEDNLVRLESSSTIDIMSNFSATTRNIFQIQSSVWELGLNGSYEKASVVGYIDDMWRYEHLRNFTFLTYYVLPTTERYYLHTHVKDYSSNHLESSRKFMVEMERPEVTPFHIYAEVTDLSTYRYTEASDDGTRRLSVEKSHASVNLSLCHKDNFLYMFPMLDTDFRLGTAKQLDMYRLRGENLPKEETNYTGKLNCYSKGIYIPLCNLINLSFTCNTTYFHQYDGPWVANFVAQDEFKYWIDEVALRLYATYDKVRPARLIEQDYYNIILGLLDTRYGDDLLKHKYNFDYAVRRVEEDAPTLHIVNGTFIFTKMFEWWDFFELSDEHRWNVVADRDLRIWANSISHTTDANLSSESVTFSSQYVSLMEQGEGSENGGNITWMELRSNLNSIGFGTLKALLLQPSTLVNSYEGKIHTDFSLKTEFSPVKTFRVLFSHDHRKTDNDDDELSKTIATLTKLDGVLNEREISGANTLTVAVGELVGIGNSFLGNCQSTNEIKEYLTINTFVVSPMNIGDIRKENLIHGDVSASWTNVEDEDTDIRVTCDLLYGPYFNGVPSMRVVYTENSTDYNIERNRSILFFPSSPTKGHYFGYKAKVPETVFSDTLDDLSFSQLSLQSISQQAIEGYYNPTITGQSASEDEVHDAYNFKFQSNTDIHNTSSNVFLQAKFITFEETFAHCYASYGNCGEDDSNSTSFELNVSNYCNLVTLPTAEMIYASSF